jgi:nitroreductase
MLITTLKGRFIVHLTQMSMNIGTYECIVSKLDIRQFKDQEVSNETRLKILEAGRQSGTGLNTQHLRFVLVDHKDVLKLLAEDSTSGSWVSGANFAIIVLTSPNFRFSMIDAGRALQNMQLAAWSEGIGSGLFTGVREEKMRKDFNIPEDLNIAVIVGFGYPSRRLIGRVKNRMPLDKVVYYQRYGNSQISE